MHSLMELLISLSLFFGGIIGVLGSNQLAKPKHHPKLFVFGDSYADTGNMNHDEESWKSPYGITYPGKPSGRYSDGLVASDFLAKELSVKSPYLWTTHGKNKKRLHRGMNFAYGEATLFEGKDLWPNMSAQVGFLVDLLVARRVYTFADLTTSDVAVLFYSGSDYLQYVSDNGLTAYKQYVRYLVKDIRHCLWKLDGIIFKNIAVTSLFPIGCLPYFTFGSSYKRCNKTYRVLVDYHNKKLKETVAELNDEARVKRKGQHFFIVDLHRAFMYVFKKKGTIKFKNMLKPCCEGECALVGKKGEKKYTLCNDPKSHFFWDKVNPTQEGWRSIYSWLGNPIRP